MADKFWYDEQDTLEQQIVSDKKLYTSSIEDMPEWTLKGEGGYEEAKSFLDLGRGCPFCGGILKYFEKTKKGTDVVYCSDCSRQMFPNDFDHRTETVDKLYKSIPDDLVMYYDSFLRQERKALRDRTT